MKLSAPAKVNLHLDVLRRRDDGFHEIETLMVPISLADDVTVTLDSGDAITVTCDLPGVPLGPENLAAAAARAFAEQTGCRFAARIHLEKRVPMGAGLGGGSSDAAAVVLALDRLLETHLDLATLESIAARVGSDVPFFIRRQPAICRGRGEHIEPFALDQTLHFLLVKPAFGVNTAWAYKNWSTSEPMIPEETQTLGALRIFNSLERPVFEKYLLLPALKQWLRQQPGVLAAAMSGSGSTMFAVLSSAAEAEALSARVKAAYGEDIWTASCSSLEA